jgi:hypothetical protein
MASQIAASLRQALHRVSTAPSREDVHFHVDGHGRPYVCDHYRCDSPGLTAREAALAGSYGG